MSNWSRTPIRRQAARRLLVGPRSSESNRFDTRASGRPAAFIGRRAELAPLNECLRPAEECEGQACLILGEPASAKSRRVREVHEKKKPANLAKAVQALPFHEHTPLHPFGGTSPRWRELAHLCCWRLGRCASPRPAARSSRGSRTKRGRYMAVEGATRPSATPLCPHAPEPGINGRAPPGNRGYPLARPELARAVGLSARASPRFAGDDSDDRSRSGARGVRARRQHDRFDADRSRHPTDVGWSRA